MLSTMYNTFFGEPTATAAADDTAESSVVSAMDTVRMPEREGENGHPEFSWNSDDKTLTGLRDRTVQLFFQLVRPQSAPRMNRLKELGKKYTSLVRDTRDLPESVEKEHLMRILWALPTQTRDCVEGKGERDLAYTLLVALYEDGMADSEEFLRVIRSWVRSSDDTPPPGSWKDVVNLCRFISEWCGENRSHPLISGLIKLLSDRLREDESHLEKGNTSRISLAAKWAPRESSKKNRWLFHRLVRAQDPSLGSPSVTPTTTPKFTGASRRLRKCLSRLNREIGTIEVKQCGGKWAEIDPTKIPAVALQKQKVALLNEIRRKSTRRTDDLGNPLSRSTSDDRVACAKNFRELAESAARGDPKATVRAQRTSLYDLVRDAFYGGVFGAQYGMSSSSDSLSKAECELLEAQWKDNGKQVKPGLPPMIPMVDTSGSMTVDKCTPLFYAMGLGLRASEKTHPAFRHRVLTFSSDPAWVRLPNPETDPENGTFMNRLRLLQKAPWGMNTDFYKALALILTTLRENSVPPEDAKNLVLVVFSDMQIDAAITRRSCPRAMHDEIKAMYAEYGYEPPHILYWNLRTSDGFPAVTTEKNVTMLSGFSPVLLNTLENKGIAALHEYTPFRIVAEQLEKERFMV